MPWLKIALYVACFAIGWIAGKSWVKNVKKPVDKEIETNYSKDVRQW